MTEPYIKDPFDKEDYGVKYADWMAPLDTILTSDWVSVPTGLTITGASIDNVALSTSCFVEGGNPLTDYDLTNSITTTGGRKKERSIKILVRYQ